MFQRLSCCFYKYVFLLGRIPAGSRLHRLGSPLQSSQWTTHSVNKPRLRLGTTHYYHCRSEWQDIKDLYKMIESRCKDIYMTLHIIELTLIQATYNKCIPPWGYKPRTARTIQLASKKPNYKYNKCKDLKCTATSQFIIEHQPTLNETKGEAALKQSIVMPEIVDKDLFWPFHSQFYAFFPSCRNLLLFQWL